MAWTDDIDKKSDSERKELAQTYQRTQMLNQEARKVSDMVSRVLDELGEKLYKKTWLGSKKYLVKIGNFSNSSGGEAPKYKYAANYSWMLQECGPRVVVLLVMKNEQVCFFVGRAYPGLSSKPSFETSDLSENELKAALVQLCKSSNMHDDPLFG